MPTSGLPSNRPANHATTSSPGRPSTIVLAWWLGFGFRFEFITKSKLRIAAGGGGSAAAAASLEDADDTWCVSPCQPIRSASDDATGETASAAVSSAPRRITSHRTAKSLGCWGKCVEGAPLVVARRAAALRASSPFPSIAARR